METDPALTGNGRERSQGVQRHSSQRLGFKGRITTWVMVLTRTAVLRRSHLPPGGHLAMAGDSLGCLGTGMPLPSSGQRPGVLPNALQCTGRPPPKAIPSGMFVGPRLGTPDLGAGAGASLSPGRVVAGSSTHLEEVDSIVPIL